MGRFENAGLIFCEGDVNNDGVVNILDMVRVTAAFSGHLEPQIGDVEPH